jgi:hypothetical protein
VIRRDKYKAGDRVVLDPTFHAFEIVAKRHGTGPFTVKGVVELPSCSWRSAGHTQWVVMPDGDEVSGAYFLPVVRS